jgi:hypothetical protein
MHNAYLLHFIAFYCIFIAYSIIVVYIILLFACFVHILCISCAYFLHITAYSEHMNTYSMHITCILHAYLQIAFAYSLHIFSFSIHILRMFLNNQFFLFFLIIISKTPYNETATGVLTLLESE